TVFASTSTPLRNTSSPAAKVIGCVNIVLRLSATAACSSVSFSPEKTILPLYTLSPSALFKVRRSAALPSTVIGS
ncbi:hypothetical protein CP8484711_0644B, partial [Chlamydia psittaci 84-8471/1]